MKAVLQKLSVVCGKHQTCKDASSLLKKMYKFNKQRINNELRTNDYNKVFIDKKKANDAANTSC